MIGLLVFLAEAILDGSSGGSPGAAANSPSPTTPLNPINFETNLQALINQFPASDFVGGTYNSGVINNPIVQAQREMAQGQAIQQQVAIQIASGTSNVTSPTGTPIQIRAPSGSTKSFN